MNGEPTQLLPALLTLAIYALIVPRLDRRRNGARTFVAALAGLLGIRYIGWRLAATVVPATGSALQVGWIWFCFAVELAAMAEMLVFLLMLSRTADRRQEADDHGRRLMATPPERWPSVDVLIPTYNEGPEVVEKTIVGARALDYPRFRVWVLDDGRRAWLAATCVRLGVGYLTRPDNRHAKAGNLNAGLARTKGELIAILDADFVPYRAFLKRTVGFFADPAIGIVQTPQHFYNRDPIQNNLLLQSVWPDEQRLFFDVMAPSRDAWNAAFCCGSCSVVRRAALLAIGGVPTPSVTEDLLTTLAMLRRGYLTRYLNEPLSAGLAPETTEAFFIQRQRWARGAIQSLYLPEGPFGPGLTPGQRLLFFPFSWIVQYPVRMMTILVPIVYLWSGLTPLVFADIDSLLDYQLPMLLGFMFGLRWLAPHHYVPLLSGASGLFATFRLLPAVLASLLRPFGHGFGVTPKGRLASGGRFDARTFVYAAGLGVATMVGLLVNTVPEWQPLETWSFFPVAAAWGFLNLVQLMLVMLICVEAPRRRREERFAFDEAATLAAAGVAVPCRLLSLSLAGALVRAAADVPGDSGAPVVLSIDGVGEVAGIRVGGDGGRLRIAFRPLPLPVRDALIVKLFTGAGHAPVAAADLPRLLAALARRAFGPGTADPSARA